MPMPAKPAPMITIPGSAIAPPPGLPAHLLDVVSNISGAFRAVHSEAYHPLVRTHEKRRERKAVGARSGEGQRRRRKAATPITTTTTTTARIGSRGDFLRGAS